MKRELGFEMRKMTLDDLSPEPGAFVQDGGMRLARHYNWGMVLAEGDSKPFYYLRSMTGTGYRSGNLCLLGDGALAPQLPSPYFSRMAQAVPSSPYTLVNGEYYEQKTESPFSRFRYYADHAEWEEGDFLHIRADYFPYAMIAHNDSPWGYPYLQQHCIFSGTLDGRPIHSMGSIDRTYSRDGRMDTLQVDTDNGIFVLFVGAGQREDGRRECVYATIEGKNGFGAGAYWIENEEPILSTEVTLEADWQKYPYLQDDPTVVYTKAVWRFGGKEFHVDGRFGSKGHTQEPRVSMPGFSHSYGPWYEGEKPYAHTMYHTLCENHSATVSSANAAGFTIQA